MPTRDTRIDAYIEAAQPFARPLLKHLRRLVHRAVPGLTEDIKWGMPFFVLDGTNLCSMSAFKAHAAFVFVHGDRLSDPAGVLIQERGKGMGQLGKLTKLADLPDDAILLAYLAEAVRQLAAPKPPREPRKPSPVALPDALADALRRDRKAAAAFKAMAPGYRREYAAWIADAKTESTRERRLAAALEWIADGKPRHWKSMKRWA
jgi:uncharacterized protein YdeI (YjbR/CyaY-like superfamily)